MAYQAIYRKWRPQVFEDIIGQGHITKTLKNQVMSGRISHAYLFCGTRGTGKTTAAKVLARAVNCLSPKDGSPCNECEICRGIQDGSILDVTEIDAASNNSVDNIRELREDVNYVATRTKYRVYIIDEVHMLSGGAFNALLKTLEEPPSHVIFILATTEVHKIPETILSRCQRFDFKRITSSDIIVRMKEIAAADGLNISEDAFLLLAQLADGSMRDGLSILERCVSACGNQIDRDNITEVLGMAENDLLISLADAIITQDSEKVISHIDEISREGKDLNVFFDSLIKHFRDLLVCKIVKNPSSAIDYSQEMLVRLRSQADKTTYEKLSNAVTLLTKARADAKWVKNPRVIYELALIKLTRPELDTSKESLLDRLASVEEKAKNGIVIKEGEKKAEADTNKEVKKKSEVSAKLFAPIDVKSLTSSTPIVSLARNWDNICSGIITKYPFLGFLCGRKITIDGEGILLLFNENEVTQKKLAAKYISTIQEAFCDRTGSSYKVKPVFEKDVEDVMIDYWNLPSGPKTEVEKTPSAEVKLSADNLNPDDPLDRLSLDYPELVSITDTSSDNPTENASTVQEDMFEDDREEFLDSSETNDDSDEDIT